MATTSVTPIQLLRSQVNNKRPDPAKLLPGQGAVNTNSAQPGLFFADDTGTSLFKVGPCTVGVEPPNSNDPLNPPSPDAPGNTLGELWLDLNGDPPLFPGPTLKVWDGSAWINCFPAPSIYALPLVQDTTPDLTVHSDNTLWWNSGTGLMYVLYNDGNSRQWTQVSSATVS
jgi:hypothetical protein